MPDYTDDDVARLADVLRGSYCEGESYEDQARDLLNQGVTLLTPPPDPADVVARRLSIAEGSGGIWQPDNSGAQRRLLAAVRELFTPDALKAAAAKVQGADRGE